MHDPGSSGIIERVASPAELTDQVVSDFVAPAMKAAGYRKTARNWHLDLGDAVTVVNLQGSSWNSRDRSQFTANLGIWFPAAESIAGSPERPNRKPPEYQCTVRERIGYLMPEGRDVWWELDSTAHLESTGIEVTAAIVDFGLPWLSRCSDPLAAFDYLRSRNHQGHSPVKAFALALSVGRADLARAAYAEWSSQPDVLPDGPIHQWVSSHSID